MASGKVKISWIENQKARQAAYKMRRQSLVNQAKELTILCDLIACLVFYSPDDKEVMTWPSQKEAEFLFDKYFSLPPNVRKVNAVDQESFLKKNINRINEELADTRKANMEYEIDDLMFQLQEDRSVYDLTETEVATLTTYSENKIVSLKRELACKKHCNPTSVNEPSPPRDETPMLSNVVSELGGISFNPTGSGSFYLMDRWLPLNETHKSGGANDP